MDERTALIYQCAARLVSHGASVSHAAKLAKQLMDETEQITRAAPAKKFV